MKHTIVSLKGVVGLILTESREKQSLSIEDLSNKTGVAVARLTSIEAGSVDPTLSELFIISEALGRQLEVAFHGPEMQSLSPLESAMFRALEQGKIADALFTFAWLVADHEREAPKTTEPVTE